MSWVWGLSKWEYSTFSLKVMGRFRRPRTTWSRVSIETIASLLNENDFDYLEILDQLLVRKRRIFVELGHGHGGQPGGGVELGRRRDMLAEHQGLEKIIRYFSSNIIFITVFTGTDWYR